MRNKTRLYILLFWLISNSCSSVLYAQNWIGLHKDDIERIMSITQKNFRQNTDFVNKRYKYLKYEDRITEQTVMFFLTEGDTCKLVRWISDYSNINDILSYLNEHYSKVKKNKWQYAHKDNQYCIFLKEEDWYFTVTYKQKEE